jgi:cellobionic acid phosphorylase
LQGDSSGLAVNPQLPKEWSQAKVVRDFRGATFNVDIKRADVQSVQVSVDGVVLARPHIDNIVAGRAYQVEVLLPH